MIKKNIIKANFSIDDSLNNQYNKKLFLKYNKVKKNILKHRNPGKNNQNAAKLVDKYNNLAREALSSGDKILSENYLQHADHFSRILSIQEINRSQNLNNNVIEKDFQLGLDETKSEKEKEDSLNNIGKVK